MKNTTDRFEELADRSFSTGTYTFTDFLGIAEISDLHAIENKITYAGVTLFGGYENADRCIARFGKEESLGYDVPFPIVCIHIKPLAKKFADDLSHRDFLGALMNLGIERHILGDIKVSEKEAYIFCLDNMAEYICDNLSKVKHTSVKCELADNIDDIVAGIINEAPHEKVIVVSSLRVDGIISKVYNLSRSESLELFRDQKVYVNGRLTENNSYQIKSGDVINARGFGKMKISGDVKETKKGKISLGVEVFK